MKNKEEYMEGDRQVINSLNIKINFEESSSERQDGFFHNINN